MSNATYKRIISIIAILAFLFVSVYPFKKELKNGTVKYAPKSKLYEITEYEGERTVKIFGNEVDWGE